MDEIARFKRIKKLTEAIWQDIEFDKDMYGYQTQPGTRWNKGLSEQELRQFEQQMGFAFPETLKNYYRVMNGVDKPAINLDPPMLDDDPDYEPRIDYQSMIYGYPDDLSLIKENIDWIFTNNRTSYEQLAALGASRIFPIYSHRFMLIDVPGNPILSMYGSDIVFIAKDIFQLLKMDLGYVPRNYGKMLKNARETISQIKFWYIQR